MITTAEQIRAFDGPALLSQGFPPILPIRCSVGSSCHRDLATSVSLSQDLYCKVLRASPATRHVRRSEVSSFWRV